MPLLKQSQLTKEQLLKALAEFGLQYHHLGAEKLRVVRDGCAAVVDVSRPEKPKVERIGVLRAEEIASCVHRGFQLFFETEDGKSEPATAEELKKLHEFEQDLLKALGLESLYNISLGTVCSRHRYDRLELREKPKRSTKPWELKKAGE